MTSRFLSLALCTGLLAGFASAQSISSVTSSNDSDSENPPIEACVGSILTIEGTGFGTAKPKVFLTDGDGKKYVLKVTDNDDTHIMAEIKKAVAGELTLNVQLKGVDEPLTQGVTVMLPEIDAGELPANADANAEFTIAGQFFGTKKGKLYIGGRKAKVVEWTDGSIVVVMPKTLANGFWDIVLDNKLGVDEDETIETTNSDAKVGKNGFNVYVEGIKLKLKVGKGAAPGGYAAVAFGTSLSNPSHSVAVAVPFVDGGELPQTFVQGKDLFVVTYVKTTVNGPGQFTVDSYLPDEGFTCTISAAGGGQVAGEFHGTMTLVAPPNTQIDVDGDFVVETIDLP